MSRLDDELRLIYGRKEPSHDFTDRVMERIAQQSMARESMARESRPRALWWQQLAEMFTVPKVRWAAAGVAASLVIAVLIAQYGKTPQTASEQGGPVTASNGAANTAAANTAAANSGAASGASGKLAVDAPHKEPVIAPRRPVAAKKNIRPAQRITERQKPAPQDQNLIAEGEAAKQRLMLALQIASSTLGEAQRIIHDDARREPVSNR